MSQPATISRSAGVSEVDAPVRLTILIIMYNALDFSKKALESIQRHTRVPYEVHLLNNGSTDETAAWLKELQAGPEVVKHFSDQNLGVAGGRNYLLRHAGLGEYVVFLDNDVEVFDGWDQQLIDAHEAHPGVGAAGQAGWFLMLGRYTRVVAPADPKAAEICDTITGYCMCFKREALRRTGLLEEGFGLYLFEDDDYCLRLKLAGYDVLSLPTVPLIHYCHKSSSTLPSLLKPINNLKKQRFFAEKWRGKAKLIRGTSHLFQRLPYTVREVVVGAKDLFKTYMEAKRALKMERVVPSAK